MLRGVIQQCSHGLAGVGGLQWQALRQTVRMDVQTCVSFIARFPDVTKGCAQPSHEQIKGRGCALGCLQCALFLLAQGGRDQADELGLRVLPAYAREPQLSPQAVGVHARPKVAHCTGPAKHLKGDAIGQVS